MADLIVVTGMAGAGRTTALRALEDAGFEAVDNLPLSLLPTIADARDSVGAPLAVGIDTRSRQFAPDRLLHLLAHLRHAHPGQVSLVYLECDDEILVQRFTETRRRHPMADRPVVEAIHAERTMMAGIREAADELLDTTSLTAQELRRAVVARYAGGRLDNLAIEVVSFAYRHGIPREADLVFDVRFLNNPHWEPSLQPLTGMDPGVQSFIREDSRFPEFIQRLSALLELLVPAYRDEGKSYLTVAFGCTGGKHRSVFVAELAAGWLAERGFKATLRHREQAVLREIAAAGQIA